MKLYTKVMLGLILLLGVTLSFILIKEDNNASTIKVIDPTIKTTFQVSETLKEPTVESNIITQTIDSNEETTGKNVTFKNMTYKSTLNEFTVKGTLEFNSNETQVLTVKLFCNDVELSSAQSNMNGNFVVVGNCAPNKESYVQVNLDNKVFQSARIVVPYRITNGRTHTTTITSVTKNPSGVPEFSTLSMGAAVIVVTLGLIFLRKN